MYSICLDNIKDIIKHLSKNDILNLMLTCKYFYDNLSSYYYSTFLFNIKYYDKVSPNIKKYLKKNKSA